MLEDIEREISNKRRPTQELVYSALGSRKMQIIKQPVDGGGVAYEFSLDGKEMIVSRSDAWLEDEGPFLKGYTPLKCPASAVKGIFTKLTNFTMPYYLPHLNVAGMGGTSYEVTIWGGIYQSVTLRWWGDAPGGGWKVYTDLVLESIEFLEILPVDPQRDEWWKK